MKTQFPHKHFIAKSCGAIKLSETQLKARKHIATFSIKRNLLNHRNVHKSIAISHRKSNQFPSATNSFVFHCLPKLVLLIFSINMQFFIRRDSFSINHLIRSFVCSHCRSIITEALSNFEWFVVWCCTVKVLLLKTCIN